MLSSDLTTPSKILFLDVNLPKMNGIEFLKEIRKLSFLNHLPVVMYSTSTNPSDIEKTQNYGAKKIAINEIQKKWLLQLIVFKKQEQLCSHSCNLYVKQTNISHVSSDVIV